MVSNVLCVLYSSVIDGDRRRETEEEVEETKKNRYLIGGELIALFGAKLN